MADKKRCPGFIQSLGYFYVIDNITFININVVVSVNSM